MASSQRASEKGRIATDELPLSEDARSFDSSALADIFALLNEPDLISFGGGFPDPDWFIPEIAEITNRVLTSEPGRALQYCPTPGIPELREFMAERASKVGITGVGGENVLITTGALQGIDLVSRVLLDPGDVVITEAPTYVGAIECFHSHRARIESVTVDDDGLVTTKLEELLDTLERQKLWPKFLYTMPNFQNPAGVTMSLERRRDLIRISREHNLIIVEDNAYGELSYEGPTMPVLKALDTEDLVVQLGTFSKIFSPGFRLGWMIASKELIGRFIMFKQVVDQCSSTLGQILALECGRRGLIEQQIERSIASLREKATVTLDAIAEYFPPGVSHTVPTGGFYTWISHDRLDMEALLPVAVREQRVGYVSGPVFHADHTGQNKARLSYSLPNKSLIVEGIKRLGELFTRELTAQ